VWLRQATKLAVPAGSLTLEGRELVLSAVKPSSDGDGIVLRCYNSSSSAVDGAWRLPFNAARAWRVRADEREPESLVLEDGGRTVRFRAGPHAIVSVLLKRDRA
jgi:alpha-mannosidase